MTRGISVIGITFTALLLLLSCSSQTPPPAPSSSSSTHLDVSGARVALLHLEDISKGDLRHRASALLGLYVADYLGESPAIPFTSAVRGIDALQKLSPTEGNNQNGTFELLQSFGNVLKVNIQDEMNRSQDRPGTLNAYMETLADITERSKTETDSLVQRQKDLDAKVTEERRTADGLRAKVSADSRAGDYAQAGDDQKALAESQGRLAALQSTAQQTKDLVRIFQNLLTISDKRRQAIEQNREIIISGLKVVDVPGIEDLGILQQTGNRKGTTNTRTNTNNFFGF